MANQAAPVYSGRSHHRYSWNSGADIKILGILFILSGFVDLVWTISNPGYALKVFGTTFDGIPGLFVKLQHPFIHWLIGYGFWNTRRWVYLTYLFYLALACLSEITTQVVQGYHPIRTTMVMVSILFGCYIIWRRSIFQPSAA